MFDFDFDFDFFNSSDTPQKPLVWLPKQKSLLECDQKRIVAYGGFGSGKSIVCFHKFFSLEFSNEHFGLLIGYTSNSIKLRLNQYFQEIGESLRIADNKLNFEYLGRFYVISGADTKNRSSSFRGLNIACALVSELTAFGFLKESFKEVLNRVRVGCNTIICEFNPSYPSHWAKKELVDSNLWYSFHFKTTENTHLSDLDEYILTIGGDDPTHPQYLRNILGEFVLDDKFPFSKMSVENLEFSHFDYCFFDPSSKGRDKSAVSFVLKNGDKWHILGYAENEAFEDFLNLHKVRVALAKTRKIYYEDNILGTFASKHIKAIVGHNRVYGQFTKKNKVERILKMAIPISQKQIVFSQYSDTSFLDDIHSWNFEKKGNQEDGAIDSVSLAFEARGII